MKRIRVIGLISVVVLCLIMSTIITSARARHNKHLTTYSSEYQQNMSNIGSKWLKVGVSTGWPGWDRTDTITATSGPGMHGPQQALAFSIGKDFVKAREISGYSHRAAANCYVDTRKPDSDKSEVYHILWSKDGLLIAHRLSASELPWSR